MKDYKFENREFFEKAPESWLAELAKTKGLEENIDLITVRSDLLDCIYDSRFAALEIGFGYGRVITFLQKENPSKPILAIDHSSTNFDRQRGLASDSSLVRLRHGCITSILLDEKINLALWMWAGIFELDDSDKKIAFSKISAALIPNGKLVVEFPDEIIGHENIDYGLNGHLNVNTEFGKLNVFRCSAETITSFAILSGLELLKVFHYQTTSCIKRQILVFGKKI